MAALGHGAVAGALGRRLLATPDTGLARLRGVAAPGLLVVLGKYDDLPWVDGLTYLGRDPDAPGLLLPTTLEAVAPPALLARAVLASLPAGAAPVALLPQPALLVATGAARPIERSALAGWLASERQWPAT